MSSTQRRTRSSAKKRTLSADSRKSRKSYKRVPKNDELEMVELNKEEERFLAIKNSLPAIKAAAKALRPHDIYDRTKSMPNKELRLMDIPVKSNLFFQMLLFYHKTYDPLYFVLMMGGCLHRI